MANGYLYYLFFVAKKTLFSLFNTVPT